MKLSHKKIHKDYNGVVPELAARNVFYTLTKYLAYTKKTKT